MKHLFTMLNLWRLWPHLLIYYANKDEIQEDLMRMGYMHRFKNKNSVYSLLYILIWNLPFRNIFYYRYKKNFILCLVGKLLLKPMESLEIGGKIGKGLVIYHGNGAVIQPHVIGENCSIWQQVTIGRRPKDNFEIDKPIIGNNVCIYAGAIVLGNITIGNNAEIGAGSVCIKDVPDNAIVVGNPARVVRIKGDEK
ncbi:serine acetyltransferase [Bacillus sp. ET1]|nr:serine acetyltransferase [Bacillus sp. ET1]